MFVEQMDLLKEECHVFCFSIVCVRELTFITHFMLLHAIEVQIIKYHYN